jgi:hypothetical protein
VAYNIPTVASFRALYPEFSAVPDANVQFALDQAQGRVDGSWTPANATLGILYFTAHLLAVGILSANQVDTGGQLVSSERIGEMSLSYKNISSYMVTALESSLSLQLLTTPYGRSYNELCTLENPAVLVI